jgi:hypothetical protein
VSTLSNVDDTKREDGNLIVIEEKGSEDAGEVAPGLKFNFPGNPTRWAV